MTADRDIVGWLASITGSVVAGAILVFFGAPTWFAIGIGYVLFQMWQIYGRLKV